MSPMIDCWVRTGEPSGAVADEDAETLGIVLYVLEKRDRRLLEELTRGVAAERVAHGRHQRGDLAVDDDGVDALLAAEVLVDDRLRHLRTRRDLLDGGAPEAALREDLAGHPDELLAALGTRHPGAHRRLRGRGHADIIPRRRYWPVTLSHVARPGPLEEDLATARGTAALLARLRPQGAVLRDRPAPVHRPRAQPRRAGDPRPAPGPQPHRHRPRHRALQRARGRDGRARRGDHPAGQAVDPPGDGGDLHRQGGLRHHVHRRDRPRAVEPPTTRTCRSGSAARRPTARWSSRASSACG